jgi:hypothetical protein
MGRSQLKAEVLKYASLTRSMTIFEDFFPRLYQIVNLVFLVSNQD